MAEASQFPWEKITEYPLMIVLIYLLIDSYRRADKLVESVTKLLTTLETMKDKTNELCQAVNENRDLIKSLPERVRTIVVQVIKRRGGEE